MEEICASHARVVQASEISKSGPKSSKDTFFPKQPPSPAINPKIKPGVIFGFHAPKTPAYKFSADFGKSRGSESSAHGTRIGGNEPPVKPPICAREEGGGER